MHRAPFFASGPGRAEKKNSGWGRAGMGVKSTGRGSLIQGIFGAGQGSFENFRGRGGPGQPFPPGPGRGVHPCQIPIFNVFGHIMTFSNIGF